MELRPGRLRAARERFEATVARTLGRVPAPVIARLLAPLSIERDGHRLDPQVQWADLLRRAARHRGLEHGSVARARREYRRMRLLERDPPPLHAVEDREIAGHDDAAIRIRLYHAHRERERPVLLYFHGGGGVIGDLESHDVVCRFAGRARMR
ncbi:MAG: hypothetical protein U0168_23780 [Nannocystaceae bacterium]